MHFISIIIPCRNEENTINETLDSILKNNYPIEYHEIIIVDGQSIDRTREIVNKYITQYNNIKLIDNPVRTVPVGFNLGLAIAKGDIVIRIDGHSYINRDYIVKCIEILDKTGADCVGGPILNKAKGIIGNLINIAQSSTFGVGNASFRKKIKRGKFVDTLAFGAYKSNVFKIIGGYDEDLVRNQDDEFNFRLIQNGGKIWLDPQIQSTYYPRTSLKKLFKQYLQYGFYKVRVIQKRQGFSSWRQLIPGAFVFSILSSLILFPISLIPFCLVTFSYSFVNIIATFNLRSEVNQKRLSYLLLPLIFFILHFSYGLGFLTGLIIFINKWFDKELKDKHFKKGQF